MGKEIHGYSVNSGPFLKANATFTLLNVHLRIVATNLPYDRVYLYWWEIGWCTLVEMNRISICKITVSWCGKVIRNYWKMQGNKSVKE